MKPRLVLGRLVTQLLPSNTSPCCRRTTAFGAGGGRGGVIFSDHEQNSHPGIAVAEPPWDVTPVQGHGHLCPQSLWGGVSEQGQGRDWKSGGFLHSFPIYICLHVHSSQGRDTLPRTGHHPTIPLRQCRTGRSQKGEMALNWTQEGCKIVRWHCTGCLVWFPFLTNCFLLLHCLALS